MRKMRLLDCTLRDGGYVNDWKFGHDNIANIFERLVSSGVDVIEVGFLDERRTFDPDRTIMPDTKSVGKIYGRLDRGKAMIVAMIDYGTCGIDKLQPCSESYLNGLRIIFKKEIRNEAIAFCRQAKALGYQVFAQAVSITSYSYDELMDLIRLVNDLHPFALSMVDTYGLLNAQDLGMIIDRIDAHLDPGINLGFHAHNNFQLGYANAMSLLNRDTKHDVLVDGTLYGMGKSAGNAPVELLAMSMNSQYGKKYNIEQMQEAITTSILDIYESKPWGYSLFFFIAASNRCHPNYVSYLMNKRTLSITSVNEILQQIPEEKKLAKDMKLIEQLYLSYQNRQCDDRGDIERIKDAFADRRILVIGPGGSVASQEDRIAAYKKDKNPLVISVNFIPAQFHPDYLFLTNSMRYLQMSGKLLAKENADIQIVAASNVTKTDGRFPYMVNYGSLIDEKAEFPDNSMIMLLKLLSKSGVRAAVLAGFDGYTPDTLNYYDRNMEYSFVREKADELNRYATEQIALLKNEITVQFLTDSRYSAAESAEN